MENFKSTPITRERQSTEPTNIKKLIERIGKRRAAEAVGFTTSGLSTALGRNKVSLTAEIAAEGVLAKMDAAKANPKHRLYFVVVTEDKAEGFKTVVEAMGLKVARLKQS